MKTCLSLFIFICLLFSCVNKNIKRKHSSEEIKIDRKMQSQSLTPVAEQGSKGFVETFYRGFLKRPADQGGLNYYESLIRNKGCQVAGISFMSGVKYNGENGVIYSNKES